MQNAVPPASAAALFATPGSTAVSEMPGYPEQWRDKPLNPDGTDNPIDPKDPYSLNWLKKWRVRQLFMETDLLYQFAQLVSGIAGRPTDQYFRGGATAVDSLEMLIVNVVASALHREMLPPLSETLTPEQVEKARQRTNATLREMIPSLTAGVRQGAALNMFTAGTFRPEFLSQRTPEMEAAVKRQQEVLFSTAMRKYTEKQQADKDGGKGKTMVAPTVPAGTRTSLQSSSSAPRSSMEHPPPPQVYRVLSEAEVAAPPAAPDVVDTLGDPRILLMYLLLRGNITETERKTVAQIYGPPELLLRDPERDRQIVKDMEQLERLLRRTGPSTEYLNAPQHTGILFFTPRLTAGVRQALDTVHHVCGQPSALEIDLMTHAEVRTPFAELVAYYLEESERARMPRFGGGRRQDESQRRDYSALVTLFRSMQYVQSTDEVTGESKDVLSFSRVRYGERDRATRSHQRDAYMAKHGRYYTDIGQQRPFDPDDMAK